MKRYLIALAGVAAFVIVLMDPSSAVSWSLGAILAWPIILTGVVEYVRFLRNR
ncbi:MAG: hypothetical protein QF893_12130 [Alphaproteobacteria bacterium]|jgi:hypothetical protein|nr:hypothetical protein [Alphaproteobacteria bacterium]